MYLTNTIIHMCISEYTYLMMRKWPYATDVIFLNNTNICNFIPKSYVI